MDTLNHYRQIVRDLIYDYAKHKPSFISFNQCVSPRYLEKIYGNITQLQLLIFSIFSGKLAAHVRKTKELPPA